jgi:hypothetical protein
MYGRGEQSGFDELERKFNARIDLVQNQVTSVETTVGSLQNVVSTINPVNYAEIVNNLDNSFPEWSKAAYTTLGVLPSDVTDDNRECYNWFRQLRADIDLAKNAANALKAAGHSLFATVEGATADIPQWDIVNGNIELGGAATDYDLLYQIPNDLIVPGLTLRVQFEAQLRTVTPLPPNTQFFAAFYDNTPGQKKIIEGGNFTITGSIFGDQSGTSTASYQVVASTDSGEEAISNILTLTNAPAVFTQNTHPRINFRGAPGFIKFDIYRRRGTEYVLQFTVQNSIEGTYFDVGNAPIRAVTGFPSLTATPPRAYAKTRSFAPGTLSGTGFIRHSLTIIVPTTYNSSLTAPGNQWLRMGIVGRTAEARQILIRRIGLSLGDGSWARSANDLREGVHSTRSTTAASSPTGNGGGGVGDPFPGGSGGNGNPNCVTSDTIIRIWTADGELKFMTIGELQKRCLTETLFCDSQSPTAGRVLIVRTAYASRLLRIKTFCGKSLRCTVDHPLIVNRKDINGTSAALLKTGDRVLCYDTESRIYSAKIMSIEPEFGDFEVMIPTLDGNHLFIADGFVSHNVKNQNQENQA